MYRHNRRWASLCPAVLGRGRVSQSTPLTILGSSLKGWWDFSDASTLFQNSNGTTAVAADADRIGYATDKSGTGTHVIQASANLRGTYKTNIKNGRAVCRFDGTDDFLTAALVQAQPFTVFIVCKKVATGGGPDILFGGLDATECAMVYEKNTGEMSVYAGTEQATVAADTNWHVYAVTVNAGSSVFRDNGTARTLAGSVGVNTLTKVALGAYQDGTNPAEVDVGEALIANGAVSAGNITSIESFLNSRWGVY